jgi:hypothetical protein
MRQGQLYTSGVNSMTSDQRGQSTIRRVLRKTSDQPADLRLLLCSAVIHSRCETLAIMTWGCIPMRIAAKRPLHSQLDESKGTCMCRAFVSSIFCTKVNADNRSRLRQYALQEWFLIVLEQDRRALLLYSRRGFLSSQSP